MKSIPGGEIELIVRRVLERLREEGSVGTAGASGPGAREDLSSPWGFSASSSSRGVHSTVDEAVSAAAAAQRKLVALPLEVRRKMIENIRRRALREVDALARMSVEETGLGRVPDKAAKIRLAIEKTPGVEDLEPRVFTGDDGLTLVERAPFGVIGAITPSTNPSETIFNNSIGMIAAGNAVVFNPHPGARGVSLRAVEIVNEAIVEAGGPPDCAATVERPSIETSNELMNHPGVRILVVTGGGAVVKAAFRSGKKVIAAGPGNPPVVVDETADVAKAARDIVDGASFDNNVLCIAEKEIIVVESVADALLAEMKRNGAYQVIGSNIERLAAMVLDGDHPRREFVGKDASLILSRLGVGAPPDVRLVVAEVDASHPFVFTEMLMPVIPLVRVRDVNAAIELAVEAEQGRLHTAMMHSRNIENLHEMARRINTTIFVKNAPSYAGLGFGGEGCTTYTIAGPTGEGITTARTFTRQRRCVLKDYFRIV